MSNWSSTKCGHLYCWECIIQALENKQECPICRARCLPQEVVQLKTTELMFLLTLYLMFGEKVKSISHLVDLHILQDLRSTRDTVCQLVLLRALVTRHVVLAGQKDAIPLSQPTKLALVTLLLLRLPVALAELALESETATQLELRSIFQGMLLAFDAFLR